VGIHVCSFSLPAQACYWELSPSTRSPIFVGDSVTLNLNGCASVTEITPPETPVGQVPDFLFDGVKLEKQPDLGVSSIRLTVLKSGTIEIPELKLVPNGTADPFTLRVETILTEEDKKKQVTPEGFLSASIPWKAILPYLLLSLLITLALIYIIYRYIRYRNSKKLKLPPIPDTPPLPEDEEILQLLMKLDTPDARKNPKKLAYQCSDAWKRYLSRRFEFDAEEKTTREIYEFLEKKAPDAALEFQTLMMDLDQAKFTDLAPNPLEVAQWTSRIRDWVLKTRRKPVAHPEDPAPSEEPKNAL
jgi:hypothetical protein